MRSLNEASILCPTAPTCRIWPRVARVPTRYTPRSTTIVRKSPAGSRPRMSRSMARPMSQGPPAWESAPSTTSARAKTSCLPCGRSSPRSRRAVSPLFWALSWGVLAMDSMLRIALGAARCVLGTWIPAGDVGLGYEDSSSGWLELQGGGQGLGLKHGAGRALRGPAVLVPVGFADRPDRRFASHRDDAHRDAAVPEVQRGVRVRRYLPVPSALLAAHGAHVDLPIHGNHPDDRTVHRGILIPAGLDPCPLRSEEHTSGLQSRQ